MNHICIHVGAPKTGSKTIQRSLELNSELLMERGYVPYTAPEQCRRLDPGQLGHALPLDWIDELVYQDRPCAILSHEALGRHPEVLKHFLDLIPVRASFHFVFYFRHQAAWLESYYQQCEKNYRMPALSLDEHVNKYGEECAWYDVIKRFQEHFPDAHLSVACFDRLVKKGECLVKHFLNTIGISAPNSQVATKHANKGLNYVDLLTFRVLKKHFTQEEWEVFRWLFNTKYRRSNPYSLFSVGQARRIMKVHHESNRKLFAEFGIGNQDDLFEWENLYGEFEKRFSNPLPDNAGELAIKRLVEILLGEMKEHLVNQQPANPALGKLLTVCQGIGVAEGNETS